MVLLAAALAARSAGADPLDTFGFGARAAALAGAGTVDATGAAAAHGNPAGVALGARAELVLGWGYGALALDLNGRDAGVLDAHGSDIGLAIPFEAGRGVRAGFGLAAHLPDSYIARIQLIPATEPHFVLLDNEERLVLEVAGAARLAPWLALGGGATILADAAGNGITFDVGLVGGEKVGSSALDVSLPTRAAPHVGVLVLPHRRLRLGATYRGEIDLDLKLDIVANVYIPKVATGDVLISVQAANYFTPRRATAGAAFDVTEELTVSGELAWLDWSSFAGGSPDIRILVALGISPPLVEAYFPGDGFRDTLVPRLGAEWRARRGGADVALRGGYAFLPSPVPEQIGLTSFADNDRDVIAAGAGVTRALLRPILERPVRLDVGLQWHHLRHRLTVKDQAVFPGGAFSSGGDAVRAAGSISVEF